MSGEGEKTSQSETPASLCLLASLGSLSHGLLSSHAIVAQAAERMEVLPPAARSMALCMVGPECARGWGCHGVARTHPSWGKDKGIDLNPAEGGKEGIYPGFQRGSNPAQG